MKYSHKLSDAVHILAYVVICADGDLSSTAIAASIQSNPSLVRRLMAQLSRAGLLSTQPGAVSPALGRSSQSITLQDIYHAVEQPDLLHVDPDTNLACPVGRNIQATLSGAYATVQQAAEKAMAQVTLADLVGDLKQREATRKGQ